MRSNELAVLHKLMLSNQIKRYKFRFSYNNVKFEVIFFTDEVPFTLLFGAIGTGFSFSVTVERGYDIKTYIDQEKYFELRKILGITKGVNNPFRINDFISEFNRNIPSGIIESGKVYPKDIIKYKRNVEEEDKIYFMGWKDNTINNEKVSPRNLEKTKVLIGNDIYEICKRKNISSRWTDNPDKQIKIYKP